MRFGACAQRYIDFRYERWLCEDFYINGNEGMYLANPPSEGVVAGACSEAFRSTNEINLERARKGFRARAERLRSKRLVKPLACCLYFLLYIARNREVWADISEDKDCLFKNRGITAKVYRTHGIKYKESVSDVSLYKLFLYICTPLDGRQCTACNG